MLGSVVTFVMSIAAHVVIFPLLDKTLHCCDWQNENPEKNTHKHVIVDLKSHKNPSDLNLL